jgi:hypothetical protein
MNPDIWGPHAWFLLYSVALAYPEQPTDKDKKNYYNFYMSLMDVLPCIKCRVHYTENIEKYPLTDEILSSKKLLFKWLHTIQSEVKKSQGKSPYKLTDTYEFFNKAYATNKIPFKEIISMKILIPVVLIIIGVLGLLIYNKYKTPQLNIIE